MLVYLDSPDNQKSEAGIKTICYLNDIYCNCFKLSMKSFLEELKPIVTKKYEIEPRQKSTKLKKIRYLGFSGFDATN